MPSSAKEKGKALDLALQTIEKQFGKGAIMKLGDESAKIAIETIPTGSIALDMALGVGGVPRGRIVEIYGPESSGKTTLALTIVSNAQRLGGNAVFIDAEHALDAAYAQKLGVDIANLHVAQPDTGEEALEITDHLVRSGAVDVVVIDSVAALVPRAEIEGEMGDSHVGLQARLMSQALRKLTGSISKSKTCVIFINQIRMQIGVMFGNPETTAGGRALKFYASVRLDIRRIATLKEGETAVGNRTKVKVVKNKVAAPFREAEFDILYNEGISREGELIDFGVDKLVLQKAGTWFSFGEERIGQGRENARMFLKEHVDVRKRVEGKLLPMLGLKGGVVAPAAEPARDAAAESAPPTTNGTEAAAKAGAKPAANAAAAPARPQPAMTAGSDRRR
ncbi:MAG: recombinase RecA [Candidatus Eisenbacteria bacterium]|uniref:Protein RecA n=1 Tax=Eiseniibacteriota bacterium TaxID=2212470 RepID=A0A849SL93_UNCEI|nr:recombinase RecA [Candidatus Eisenbacteria bacterium]